MEWWLAILLGILQGVTEWLPISSSGHLAIFQYYFDEEPPILFDIILHLGSLSVIFYVMRRELLELSRFIFKPYTFLSNFRNYGNLKGDQKLITMVIVASIPTAIIGLIFDSTIIGDFYTDMHLVGFCLIFTGILVWVSKDFSGDKSTDEFSYRNTFAVGVIQGLAILPGISRSGTTIAISKILGMNPEKAARFSFLLFIPAIIGATFLKFQDIDETISEVGAVSLFLGFITSVIASYFSINLLLGLIKKQQFHYFTPYCLFLGVLLIFESLT